jgi:flagellar biosynthesis protein FlhG
VDQAEQLRRRAQERRDKSRADVAPLPAARPVRVISITSGKGGVGKTNIAVNLGLALTKLKKKVMIFDTDLGLANVDILLGLKPQHTIHDVLSGEKRIQDVVVEGPGGLLIVPASSGVDEVRTLEETERLDLVAQFESWNDELDFLLLDTGAGIGLNVMYFNIVAQHILVVATPDPTSLTDAYALMKVLYTRYRERRFHLLVNMARDEKQALDVYTGILNAAQSGRVDISVNLLGWLPQDGHVTQSVRQRAPVLEAFPQSPAAKTFAKLAHAMLDLEVPRSPKGNMQFLWRHLLRAG